MAKIEHSDNFSIWCAANVLASRTTKLNVEFEIKMAAVRVTTN